MHYYILSVGTGNDFNIGFGVGAHSRYLAYTLHRICATYPPKYSDVFGTLRTTTFVATLLPLNPISLVHENQFHE